MYYYLPPVPKKKLTSFQLQAKARQMTAVGSVNDLAKLFSIKPESLRKNLKNIEYTQWTIPKPGGGKRLIESPNPSLKSLQKCLGGFLQAYYHILRPACAYGSVISPADEPVPRTILTNAQRHVKSKWFFHLDLQDFFPSITSEKVLLLFTGPYFSFDKETAQCLTNLTTYENRLPQGASSSPVIANLICLPLDEKLENLANKNQLIYTRYIDDLTFSSNHKIKPKVRDTILKIIESEKFIVHPDKMAVQNAKELPEITGLIIFDGKPELSPGYVKELSKDIRFYVEMSYNASTFLEASTLRRLYQHLLGRLSFLRMVRGETHRSYLKLAGRLGL